MLFVNHHLGFNGKWSQVRYFFDPVSRVGGFARECPEPSQNPRKEAPFRPP